MTLTQREITISMIFDFSLENEDQNAMKQNLYNFNFKKKVYLEFHIQWTYFFQVEEGIKLFSNKIKIHKFITSTSSLQKILKGCSV